VLGYRTCKMWILVNKDDIEKNKKINLIFEYYDKCITTLKHNTEEFASAV